MVRVEDLWIGDHVILKKSKRIGTYEGSKDGKLKVKCKDKIILTSAANLALYNGPVPPLIERPPKHKYVTVATSPERPHPVLDLHIEELNSSLTNGRAERILDYQVKAAKAHIELAIKYRYPKIILIHGKGEGVLKQEVLHLLSLYDEVAHCQSINAGGGTEVSFVGVK